VTRSRAVGLVGVSVTAVLVGAGWQWWDRAHTFNAREWKAERKAGSCSATGAREWMVDDLREHHLRGGMPQREILSLLGPADKVSRESDGRVFRLWATETGFTRCFSLELVFVRGRLVGVDHYD